MQVLVNPCQGLRPGADVLQGDYPMLFSVGVGRNAPPWYQPSGSGKEKPHFEFNPDHPLVSKLDAESDEDRFGDLVRLLFDQASLAEGQSLADPGDYVRRVNSLLLELLA